MVTKKWVAISGSWKVTSKQIEKDVRKTVKKVLADGGGIITGGALNVDSFAADEAVKADPTCERIKIFLPTTLKIYAAHYRKRAKEEVITFSQAEDLISLLERIKAVNPKAIIENKINKIVDQTTYFERNMEVVKVANELYAFHAIESTGGGTLDTVKKAKSLGIPVHYRNYKTT